MPALKTIFITGAAGGIGAATARLFYSLGYTLWLVDMREDALLQLQQELPGSRITAMDVTSEEAIQTLEQALENHSVDIAFLNAGVLTVGEFCEVPWQRIQHQLDVNLIATMRLNHVFGRHMKKQGYGHLINTVSMGGIVSLKGSCTYSATKFGLRGFLTGFSMEMRDYGVAVSGIYPSGVNTPMFQYEVDHPASNPLNFLSAPLPAELVAKAVLKAVTGKKLEYYLPYKDSITARLFSVITNHQHKVYPWFQRLGEKGKKRLQGKNG